MAEGRDSGPCFYCPELPAVGEKARLTEEETHHASAARRIRVGDTIGLIDGGGIRASAVVEAVSRRTLTFTVRRRRRIARPEPSIVVASAVPQGERFRTLIDMLSQMGVAGVMPLVCERSTAKPRKSARARWQRIAIEACKQSRNPHVPEIHELRDLSGTLPLPETKAGLVYADIDGSAVPEMLPGGGILYLFIGPEGGFTDREKNLLREHGGRPVSLGDNVLRVETAAVIGAAMGLLSGRNGG